MKLLGKIKGQNLLDAWSIASGIKLTQEVHSSYAPNRLENAGIKGHDAYELANQVDKGDIAYAYATKEDMKKIAEEIVEEEKRVAEALGLDAQK